MAKRTSKELEQKIISSYMHGKGTIKLSKEFNLSRSTIQRILISNRVPFRKGRVSSYDYNEYFFSEYNKKSCYWAGFISADGYIRNKGRNTLHVKLSSIDREHLSKFLKDTDSNYQITDSDLGYSYINISGHRIVNDLKVKFRVSNNKSLTLEFPEEIPIVFIPDFIRGYFDGDGSICRGKNGSIQVSFTGTKNVLDFFRNYFYYAVGVRIKSKNKVPPFSSAGNNYFISYSGKNALKIMDFIYDGASQYLDRKYIKWKNIVLDQG
jgi:intein-encoded DNA endonuclease-like protein